MAHASGWAVGFAGGNAASTLPKGHHQKASSRNVDGSSMFKPKLCRFYRRGKRGCDKGAACPYTHSPEEIRKLELPTEDSNNKSLPDLSSDATNALSSAHSPWQVENSADAEPHHDEEQVLLTRRGALWLGRDIESLPDLTSAGLHSIFFRTKLCKFYKSYTGVCWKGRACPDAHAKNELGDRINCPKSLCLDPECQFAHNRKQRKQKKGTLLRHHLLDLEATNVLSSDHSPWLREHVADVELHQDEEQILLRPDISADGNAHSSEKLPWPLGHVADAEPLFEDEPTLLGQDTFADGNAHSSEKLPWSLGHVAHTLPEPKGDEKDDVEDDLMDEQKEEKEKKLELKPPMKVCVVSLLDSRTESRHPDDEILYVHPVHCVPEPDSLDSIVLDAHPSHGIPEPSKTDDVHQAYIWPSADSTAGMLEPSKFDHAYTPHLWQELSVDSLWQLTEGWAQTSMNDPLLLGTTCCATCGKESAAGWSFCASCGEQLP